VKLHGANSLWTIFVKNGRRQRRPYIQSYIWASREVALSHRFHRQGTQRHVLTRATDHKQPRCEESNGYGRFQKERQLCKRRCIKQVVHRLQHTTLFIYLVFFLHCCSTTSVVSELSPIKRPGNHTYKPNAIAPAITTITPAQTLSYIAIGVAAPVKRAGADEVALGVPVDLGGGNVVVGVPVKFWTRI